MKQRVLNHVHDSGDKESSVSHFEKTFFQTLMCTQLSSFPIIVNAKEKYKRMITLQHLHKCWQDRAMSNLTLSCEFKETSGELRNWVRSLGKVGVVIGKSGCGLNITL